MSLDRLIEKGIVEISTEGSSSKETKKAELENALEPVKDSGILTELLVEPVKAKKPKVINAEKLKPYEPNSDQIRAAYFFLAGKTSREKDMDTLKMIRDILPEILKQK